MKLYYKQPDYLVEGTIKSIAYYDNTSANLHNPNTPPQTICSRLKFNTISDEMFVDLLSFH